MPRKVGRLIYEFQNMPNRELLAELIIYVAAKSQFDEKFGATKLNKILYYADFTSYLQYGEPVTGVPYQRLPNGPAPVPLVPVRTELEGKDYIFVQEVPIRSGHSQSRIIPRRDADLSKFKPRDIALVDDVIGWLIADTAADVSKRSHGTAWRAVRDGDKIPYNYAFLSNEPTTDLDIEYTLEVLREIGWKSA